MTTPLEKMILPIKRFFFSGMGIMTDKSRAEIQYNIFKKMQELQRLQQPGWETEEERNSR
jgi:hypothetical protein